MEKLNNFLHPEIRTAILSALKSHSFWVLLGLGFGLSYCNSKATFDSGFTPYALMSWVFFVLLSLIALVDLKRLIVPDVLVLALLVIGLFVAEPISLALWGAGILGGGFWLIRFLASKLLKQEAMGLGDVKLAFALGAWVGPWGVIPLLLVASFSALLVLVVRKILCKPATQTPFAPYLAIAGWVTFAYGGIILKLLINTRHSIVGLF